ncbi:CBO0543 family protein [Bacillus sp. B190/17]|uniref:CBO0543 family protein n=1 Tax=Bacillus lumedeiriae TaxID=3058829 RepID=A0ABW8IAC5_9BACI
MNTVKPSKNLNLPPSPKKRFFINIVSYFPAVLTASWLGTYLDLYFSGKGMYEFPLRPFAEIFSINLAFTLFALPFFTGLFLFLMSKMIPWYRGVFVLLLSIGGAAAEKTAEQWGFFRHSDQWHHSYSFFGYLLFLIIIWHVFTWTNRR